MTAVAARVQSQRTWQGDWDNKGCVLYCKYADIECGLNANLEGKYSGLPN